jgi:serine/threonine protein phosphatase PrpC
MASKHASADHCGYKYPSEDRIVVLETKRNEKVYCVFDGHSGQKCVELVSTTLPQKIVERLNALPSSTAEEVSKILLEEFTEMERVSLINLGYFDGGTTATISVVLEKQIITANIGDSPAILFTKTGEYLSSTIDHDCKNEKEVARVKGEGGWFSEDNMYTEPRLYNCLGLTRCFGNISKKTMSRGLSSIPDVYVWERTPGTLLAICSDSFSEKVKVKNGSPMICNIKSHQEIMEDIMITLKNTEFKIEEAAPLAVKRQVDTFYNYAYGKYQGDNTSLILVDLDCVQTITSDSSQESDEYNPESN